MPFRIIKMVPTMSISLIICFFLFCIFSLSASKNHLKIPSGGTSILVDPFSQKVHTSNKGGTKILTNIDGKFNKVWQFESKIKKNDWDCMNFWKINKPIKNGDVVLLSFWARTEFTADESGQSNVNMGLELHGLWKMPHKRKEFLKPLTNTLKLVAGDKWQQFFIRGKAPEDVPISKFIIPLKAGNQIQTIWFADMKLINYGPNIDVNKLPMSKYTYKGREPNAKWRRLARLRILKNRTRRVHLSLKGKNGSLLKNAVVKVELKKHAFQFGGAICSWKLNPNFNQEKYQEYRERTLENFSAVSFTNALKWHPWVRDWGENFYKENTLDSLKWVEEQKLPFRGHCMVWPRKCSVSNELAQLLKAEKPNKKLIERKILEHIRDIGAATSFCMDEWDVLNESIPCHDVQDICGDQVMIDWFKEARKVLPSKVKLALNEYSILSVLTDTEKISKHEDRIKYLLDGGAPLEVLGFQSHMGGAPPSPERIYRVLNRFSKFHLPIRATEYDIKSNDEDLIYDFTRDFLTIMFSHSSVIGVQMWTFDGFYDKDGQITTFGKAYQDLVLKKWKTVKNGRTDTKGIFSFRGYLGEYELQITVNGQKITKTFKLEKGDGTDNISIDI
jgi:GH35 family endo-1,4-beta-xylanase